MTARQGLHAAIRLIGRADGTVKKLAFAAQVKMLPSDRLVIQTPDGYGLLLT
jgi:hypothetical protein